MDFTVKRGAFLQVLNVCGRVVPQRSPLPGLQGVKISASEGTVAVLATDLEVFVSASAPAAVATPGEAVVPFKTLFSLVRLFPEDGDVALALAGRDGGSVRVRCGSSDTVLAGFPPDEFPSPPDASETSGAPRAEVGAGDLAAAVRRVGYAANPNDELRPLFAGVWVEGDESGVTLTCSDSHRLASERLACPGLAGASAIVPFRACEIFARAADGGGAAALSVAERWAVFSGATARVVTRLIDGQIPDWRGIFPRDAAAGARADAAALALAVERARLVADEDLPVVEVEVLPGRVVLRSESERGRSEEVVAAETSGSLSVHLNADYLLDALRAAGGGSAEVSFAGVHAPVTFAFDEFPGHRALLLPMRVS